MKQIAGIEVSKIKTPILTASYVKTFKTDPGDLTTTAMIDRMTKHFATLEGEVMDCDACGGSSPSKIFPDACPFCGTADEASPPEKKKDKPMEPTPKITTKSDDKKTEPNGATEKKKDKTETALVKPAAASSTALVPQTVADLDASVAKVIAIQKQGSQVMWELGTELARIKDQDLWRLRNDAAGKPAYKSWEAFCDAEIKLHHRTINRTIEVVRSFSSQTADQYGMSILRVLLAAPKEDRGVILEKLDNKEITGKRGVQAEVERVRKEKGVTVVQGEGKDSPRKRASKKASAKASSAAKEVKRQTVTAVFPVGKKTIKLFARKLNKTDPEKRAKKIADFPMGSFETQNGVTVFFQIGKDAEDQLTLSIDARRED